MSSFAQVLQAQKPHNWITPIIIGLMLFLRIAVLGLSAWPMSSPPRWIEPLFETGTYLLTLLLIWWERDRLFEYHIGRLSVMIILLFKPLQTLILGSTVMGYPTDHPMAIPGLPALIVWVAAGVMFGWMVMTRSAHVQTNPAEKRWFGVGILVGLLTAIVLSFPAAAQLQTMNEMTPVGFWIFGRILFAFIIDFPYQLGYAAVSEEPLFRGFLWGYLRRSGWQDRWIWLFQAGLFMLAHIYYANRLPYSFWVIVPIGSLVLGWLAWRTRSIAASMAAHGIMNAMTILFAYLVANWF